MAALIPMVDWREPFSLIDRALRTDGGIVDIEFDSDDCSAPLFLSTVESYFRQQDVKNKVVRINPDDHETHFIPDIMWVILDAVGQRLRLPKTTHKAIADNIASRNVAGRDLTLNIGDIIVAPDQHDDLPTRKVRRLAFSAALQRYFKGPGRLLIALPSEQTLTPAFWHELWRDGLDRYMGRQLVLVRLIDLRKAVPPPQDRPSGTVCITLPRELGMAEQVHAVEDLAEIIKTDRPDIPFTLEHTIGAITGYVCANANSVALLRAGWSSFLTRYARHVTR